MDWRSRCVIFLVILCCVWGVVCGGTVGNVTVHRVSTDRNRSKNGYAKNTVLDDIGIRVKMGL